MSARPERTRDEQAFDALHHFWEHSAALTLARAAMDLRSHDDLAMQAIGIDLKAVIDAIDDRFGRDTTWRRWLP